MNNYFKELLKSEEISYDLKNDSQFFVNESEELNRDQLQGIASAMYSVLPAKEKLKALRMIKLYKGDDINEKWIIKGGSEGWKI